MDQTYRRHRRRLADVEETREERCVSRLLQTARNEDFVCSEVCCDVESSKLYNLITDVKGLL